MEPYSLIHSQNGTLFPHPQPKWNPISSSTAEMEPYLLIHIQNGTLFPHNTAKMEPYLALSAENSYVIRIYCEQSVEEKQERPVLLPAASMARASSR